MIWTFKILELLIVIPENGSSFVLAIVGILVVISFQLCTLNRRFVGYYMCITVTTVTSSINQNIPIK